MSRLRPAAIVHLVIGQDVVRAEIRRRGAVHWTDQEGYGQVDQLAGTIRRLTARAPSPPRHAVAQLQRGVFQVRTLTDLPPVKLAHLQALVAQASGRFFRRNGHSLVTTARWLSPDRRRAHAVAAQLPLLEAIAEGARAAHLTLIAIAPEPHPALRLFPPSELGARRARARRLLRRLTIELFLIWVSAGGILLTRTVRTRDAVSRDLRELEEPVARVAALRTEFHDMVEILDVVQQSRDRSSGALRTLAALAAELPDSTVLISFDWSADSDGQAIGLARDPGLAVKALRRSASLADVRLDGSPAAPQWLAPASGRPFRLTFGSGRVGQ